ncbi:MAG: hypothetical protein Q8K65_12155 [Alphaproteobacteria bacterium]|nr:hypothetical protein [Alphaproteobacteria bacterium]
MNNEQLQPIRAAIETAEVAPAAPAPAPAEKKQAPRASAEKPARQDTPMREHEHDGTFEELPEGCPVVPLGIKENVCYYLDANQQLRELKDKDHGRLQLLNLFGAQSSWLYDSWPRVDDKGNINGWRPEKASEALMGTAADIGIIDVTDLVRGPGAWRGDDDELVMHCGDVLYRSNSDATEMPGKIGRHIYPADAPKPRPAKVQDTGTAAALQLLDTFKTWNWRRPDVDPYLLLGWLGASMIGGALKWRPLIWITGDAATGKSTLHDILTHVQGAGGMISASDASAAGLWQKVKHASLPVQLDELESEDDNRKNANIIKLARHAASGGSTLRGGADHKGAQFTVRNCFMFSSILIPPLLPQDLSRMAILELDALPQGALAPNPNPKELAKIGAAFRSRFLARWGDMGQRLDLWRGMLAQAGHGGRGADLFGTLLTCYDVLAHDGLPTTDELDEWKAHMQRSTLAETESVMSDAEKCLLHLASSHCDVYRDGMKRTVGSWIEQAANMHPSNPVEDAQKVLAAHGLRVQGDYKDGFLLVANDHQGLRAVFAGSRWGDGVWRQSMRRIVGAAASTSSTNFGGSASRYTKVPLSALFADDQKGDA